MAKFTSEEATAADVYGVPEPLQRDLLPALPYPTDALGPTLGPMACAIQEATLTPMPLCGNAVLAGAATSVQAHGNVIIDGRCLPTSLYMLTIAETGERKTSCDLCAFSPIREYEESLWVTFSETLRQASDGADLYRHRRDEILRDKKLDDNTKRRQLDALGDTPLPPKQPKIVSEDSTLQALLRRLQEHQPSMAWITDEASMFLGGFSMNRDNEIHTIGSLSKLWDGRGVVRDTVGNFGHAIPLYGRRLSVHFGMQPVIATQMLGNPLYQGQGLLSRFLIAWPESVIGTRLTATKRLDQNTNAGLYGARIQKILGMELPYGSSTALGKLEPKGLSLSSKAYGMWKEFNEDIERRMAPGEDLDILKAFANKFPELCARIAGVLTLIDNLEASEVGEKQLSSAIQLMKFYGHEIARIYCMGTVGDHLKQAQTLLDWIRSKELIEIYPVLVYQNGPSLFRTKGRALVALRTLENHGCLIPLEEGTEVDGKARKEAWQVVFPP